MNLQPDLSGLQPIDAGTLGQRVYSELRDFLMVGGVPPGEKVTLRQLTTAFGTMHGTYRMVTESGEAFDAEIAAFSLSTPYALN